MLPRILMIVLESVAGGKRPPRFRSAADKQGKIGDKAAPALMRAPESMASNSACVCRK